MSLLRFSNNSVSILHSRRLLAPLSSTVQNSILRRRYPSRNLGTASLQERIPSGTGEAAEKGAPKAEVTWLGDLPIVKPEPVRHEFAHHKLSTEELENWKVGVGYHRLPETFSDKIAFALVKFLRLPTDLFFRKKYIHRAVLLETVAAVPGMVAGALRHLTSLRRMRHDGGWITHLLHEAENERMHLMTWTKVFQPKPWERLLVLGVQGVFWNMYFVVYLLFPKVAHRFVGYLEEEAVVSYTHFLHSIDTGAIENGPAPKIAIDYWNLKDGAKLRDVVLAVRADEAAHRDVNHHLADRLLHRTEDLRIPFQPKITIVDDTSHYDRVDATGKKLPPTADAEGMIPRVDLKIQAVDQKKEDFRKYLEKHGIVDALTKARGDEQTELIAGKLKSAFLFPKLTQAPPFVPSCTHTLAVLVGLYEEPEKPDNPLDYVKHFLSGPSDIDIEAIKAENDELKRRVKELESKLAEVG
ncbi:Alternative oxidase, mitochondrial precursor [Gonapodya sp. JEL0774]|nr:Alternative oxidase, mitochondrial precursor [Gonapodya sp. JEL0774]